MSINRAGFSCNCVKYNHSITSGKVFVKWIYHLYHPFIILCNTLQYAILFLPILVFLFSTLVQCTYFFYSIQYISCFLYFYVCSVKFNKHFFHAILSTPIYIKKVTVLIAETCTFLTVGSSPVWWTPTAISIDLIHTGGAKGTRRRLALINICHRGAE